MSDETELDAERRRLLAQVLAGGAVYALPMVATLSIATHAGAQEASSSEPGTGGGTGEEQSTDPGTGGGGGEEQSGDPGTGGGGGGEEQSGDPNGQPDIPGAPGNGPERRPAPPGARGRGKGTGLNPVHDNDEEQSQEAFLSPHLPFPSGRGFG